MDGFISVLKPPGMTSSNAVVAVRRLLPKGTAVGHGGTLDPDAAGVLPVCIGTGTRLFDYMIDKQKTYIAELTLGVETDTQDQTGTATKILPVHAGSEDVKAVLPKFTGDIMQIPPMYSALKRDGQKLCDLARKGKTVELEARPVTVDELNYIGPSGENRHMIEIKCRKGVYVRTLMHDIGRTLGCGGHMSFLLRSRAGVFHTDNSHTVEEIARAGEEGRLQDMLAPADFPIQHLIRLDLDSSMEKRVINGNMVYARELPKDVKNEKEPLRVYLNGRFAGIGQIDEDGNMRFKAMLYKREAGE